MLKMVRTPSSLRTGATFFMAGWWLGANMKPMPVSDALAICSGVRLMLTPSASSTSALPDLLLTLRPPCLLTLAPAAAATNMEQVEMLKVWSRRRRCPRCRPGALSATCTLVELAHHLRGGGDLADGFLLHAQAGDDGGHHHGRHLAAHDHAHQVQHLVVEDLAVLDGALQRFLRGDGHGSLQMSLSSGRRVGQRQAHAEADEQQAGNAVEPMHAALHRADTAHQPGRRQRPAH
jgi:ribosomal protein S27AE